MTDPLEELVSAQGDTCMVVIPFIVDRVGSVLSMREATMFRLQ